MGRQLSLEEEVVVVGEEEEEAIGVGDSTLGTMNNNDSRLSYYFDPIWIKREREKFLLEKKKLELREVISIME